MAYGSTPSNNGIAGTINSLPKKVEYLGLKDFSDIQFRDTTPFSDNFFNIAEFPDSLTAGKNLFKLKASSGTLVKDAKIYIEVLDSNNVPIYHEVLDYFESDGTRVITIHVTADTPPGPAKVYIASRVYVNPETGQLIPRSKDWNNPNYIGNPNLLWSRQVLVGPDRLNKSEIIFTRDPVVSVQEVIQPYFQPLDVINIRHTKLAGDVTFEIRRAIVTQYSKVAGNEQSELTTVEAIGYSLLEASTGFFSASMAGERIFITNPSLAPVLSISTNRGYYRNSNALILPYTQTSLYETGGSPQDISYDYVGSQTALNVSGSYEFIIQDVLSSTQANIVQIYGFKNVDDNSNGAFIFNYGSFGLSPQGIIEEPDDGIVDQWTAANITASFIVPFETIQTEQSQSFAQITISDLEPASGDVYKLRTLYKPGGMFGDFIDGGDTIVERIEILKDTASFESEASVGTFYNRIGYFNNVADFDKYWTGSKKHSSNPIPATTTFSPEVAIGSISISPDDSLPKENRDYSIIHLKDQYHIDVTANTRYILNMRVAVVSDTTTTPSDGSVSSHDSFITLPRLEVYISGTDPENIIPDPATVNAYWEPAREVSATFPTYGQSGGGTYTADAQTGIESTVESFSGGGELDTPDNIGTRVGIIEISPNTSGDLKDINLNFVAKSSEAVDVCIVLRRGNWAFSDLSIKTSKETGYTPNLAQVNLRMPTQYINTPLTFKFQYLDYLSRQADLESVVYPVTFTGDNTVINGNNNLLQGSLYISNQIGTGMELAGTNSGFLRSTGYIGFKSASRTDQAGGFLIYSGSVLPSSSDNYQGVGLELVHNSSSFFKFKTNGTDAGLEVQTDRFFLGSKGSQYISGSGGNIEISSTNFTLSPEGNVTGSNILLTGNARADIFEYKNLTLTKDNSGSYLNTFTGGGDTYYELDLSTNAAMFIRIDDHLLYPIGKIKPPSGDDQTMAQTVFLESAEVNGFPIAAPPVAGTVDTEISIDSGDLISQSFAATSYNGANYPGLYTIPYGGRIMLVRSKFDWKIQSLSDFTNTTASFGALYLGDGTTITTANIDGGSFN